FSKDGERIAVGSSLDGKGTVVVYQYADAKLVSTFEGQKGAVYSVAWSPDGKTVASAGFDGDVRLNDPADGKLLKVFSSAPLTPAAAVAGK
ncbi:MAG: WD40 repeat domain-containing protein, partial [Planctomycetia bacterium]